MSTEVLRRRFTEIGARLEVREGVPWRGPVQVGVGWDRLGEYFDVRLVGEAAVEVVDVLPKAQHLLLLARHSGEKSKFLCGHDERHWFVAAVPEEARGVSGVVTAMDALQPPVVREVVERLHPRDRFKRRNVAYVRQGEWFFVPEPSLEVDHHAVVRNEPITRGRGQAHVIELVYRRGGELAYLASSGEVFSHEEFSALSERARREFTWRRFVRDADVYAKGAVRHPDHARIVLPGWHRVLMNTEQQARAMRHVVFLD